MQNLLLLVDVQNIYYTTRSRYQAHFDYNRFWAMATRGRHVIKAIAFAIAPQDDRQRQFQNILRAIGFEVKLKPYIQRADGSAKGDWDVGITLDAMEYAGEADVVILASGDGDFDLLIEKIRSKFGVTAEVYGVPQLTASSLKNAASQFIPIEKDLLLQPR